MSTDALWLIDLFQMQIASYKSSMDNVKIRRDKFDKYSYCAWAISETLMAVDDYSGYVCVGTLREILKMQLEDYRKWRQNDNEVIRTRYEHAADVIEYLLNLTRGYVNDEYSTNIIGGHIYE